MNEIVPDVTPDLPGRGWRVTLAALRRLPQGALSRGFGRLADVPIPRPLRGAVLGTFARSLGIDASEAEHPITHYGSLNEFFVRRLKPGARAWPEDDRVAGSPVDSVAGQLGEIRAGRLLQAKGRWYSAAALLADAHEAERFNGGSFITLYLSPRHYHRIHAPIGGTISAARHLPGHLLPVNAAAVTHVQDLFAVNERLVCYLDSPLGRIAIVAVGAYNVGRISAAFDPALRTNQRAAATTHRRYDPPVLVNAGDEIMAFHLGSTVVVLFEPGRAALRPGLRPGTDVLLGAPITVAPA